MTNNIPTTLELPARSLHNADLGTAVRLLQQQHVQSADIVMPVNQLHCEDGNLVILGEHKITLKEEVIDLDGVTPKEELTIDGAYLPTRQCDSQIGNLLGIPVRYLRRLREEHLGLFDKNVNEWCLRADVDQKVLVRVLVGIDPTRPSLAGVVRAVLSDRYGIRDNLDVTLASLDGVRAAGLGATNIRGLDLSDDKLFLRIDAPELAMAQPEWMSLYRSPFEGSGHGGETAARPRLVHCGILIQNSPTGHGAFTITPELRFQICDNGAQCNWDQVRKIHLGAKLDEGQIIWSSATRTAAKNLTREQVADSVRAFLSEDYMVRTLDKIGEDAGIKVANAAETIQVVAKQMSYNEGETALLLDHFIRGGLLTTGGVLHAVTSAAQEIEDVDRSNEFASTGVAAMQFAAKVSA